MISHPTEALAISRRICISFITCYILWSMYDIAIQWLKNRSTLTLTIHTHENLRIQSPSIQNKMQIEERFTERRTHLVDSCRRAGLVGLQTYLVEEMSPDRPTILYLDDYELLYCSIPKVGCTNWKKVMLYLSGGLTSEQKKDAEDGELWKVSGAQANNVHNLQPMNFWNLNKTERIKRLNKYRKFVAVRDPFERLLSAYRNKLEPQRNDSFGDISQKIHQQRGLYNSKGNGLLLYGNKISNTKIFFKSFNSRQQISIYIVLHFWTVEVSDVKMDIRLSLKNLRAHHIENASFLEFLQSLVDHGPNAIPKNNHWATYSSLCFPCDIQYDYILKLETIEDDSEWLFNKFNITNIQYPKGNKAPSNSNRLSDRLASVSNNLQKAVYHYLQKDYNLFAYPTPDGIL